MNAITRSKVFLPDRGMALHLPDSLGISEGAEYELIDHGVEIVLMPVRPPESPTEREAQWTKMIDAMRALGPVGEIEVREPIEFPDRPGL
ncbi:MAG: hypothetical protein JO290_00480 [Sphingomonadaceae bacterium]|nr:hypothetical protein [Sphingomonadaceae bacterium]